MRLKSAVVASLFYFALEPMAFGYYWTMCFYESYGSCPCQIYVYAETELTYQEAYEYEWEAAANKQRAGGGPFWSGLLEEGQYDPWASLSLWDPFSSWGDDEDFGNLNWNPAHAEIDDAWAYPEYRGIWELDTRHGRVPHGEWWPPWDPSVYHYYFYAGCCDETDGLSSEYLEWGVAWLPDCLFDYTYEGGEFNTGDYGPAVVRWILSPAVAAWRYYSSTR